MISFAIKGITTKRSNVSNANSIDLRLDKNQTSNQLIRQAPEGAGHYFLIIRTMDRLGRRYKKAATTNGSTGKQSQVGPEPWVYRVSGRSLTPLVSFKFLSLCGFEALCEHLSFLRCCKFIISHLYHSVNSN